MVAQLGCGRLRSTTETRSCPITAFCCPVLVSRGWFLHTTSEGLKALTSKKNLLKFHFRYLKIIFWHLATAFDTKPKDRHKSCQQTGQLDLLTNPHYLDLKLQSKEHMVFIIWD